MADHATSCLTTVAYCVGFFLPIILNNNMGFTVGASQCLIAPPYAFAGTIMLGAGSAGDKYRMRGAIMILLSLIYIF